MGDQHLLTPAAAFSAEGLKLVARAAAVCRSLPASHALATAGSKAIPQLLHKTDKLLAILSACFLTDSDSLERANDRFLNQLDKDLAIFDGKPLPIADLETIQQLDLIQNRTKQTRPKIPRPQFLFKDQIDNSSETLWVPKLVNKFNAITPLKLVHTLDINGKPDGYLHPYLHEIEVYKPSDKYFQPDLLPKINIKRLKDTPLSHIITKDDLDQLIQHLRTVDEIAVDVEHHSYRSFQGITCLVQITTSSGDFLIDALSLREHLHLLNESFTNPNILKVFHGAISDIIWLQRDLGVYVVGMFDTYEASATLNLPQRSLKYLLHKYCNITVDKQFQLADWRQRPLTPDMCQYARLDTHNLIYIWRKMREELLQMNQTNSLESVFESSKLTCLSTYKKSVYTQDSHLELLKKSKKSFDSRQQEALRLLYKWRDNIAREEDESTGYVLPNHMLLEIASNLPKETSGILACCVPPPPLLLHHLNVIRILIDEARIKPLVNNVINETPKIQTNQSFHLMIFDRQTKPPTTNDYFQNLKSLQNINQISDKKSIISSDNSLCNQLNLCNISDKFCTPYERCILVKKYNTAVKNDQNKIVQQVPPVLQVVSNLPVVIDEYSNKHKLIEDDKNKNTQVIEPPPKKTKLDNGEPEFVHQYVKPNKNNGNKNTQESDDTFKPFDYKNFDYKVFNKEPRHNKFNKERGRGKDRGRGRGRGKFAKRGNHQQF